MPGCERYGWKKTSSSLKYRNPWISVREDKVVFPCGSPGIYGVVEKGPGVCVVPAAEDGGIYLLRQYRYTIDAEVWELPAGAIDRGESETAAVRRELAEETDLSARRLKRLGAFYTALGHETASIIAYLATGLRTLPPRGREKGESIIEIRKVSQAGVRRMMRANRIRCGISLAALGLYFERLTGARTSR